MITERVLTGDRPTGKLHLGHYKGSLENRVSLQEQYEVYILIADYQAMTDYFAKPDLIKNNIKEVLLDYLAVGIDPLKSTIFLQSSVLETANIFQLYLNFANLNQIKYIPTIKSEMQQKEASIGSQMGFLSYPVSQAVDIHSLNATLVPVGEDQMPVIEYANTIGKQINATLNSEIAKPIKGILSNTSRLKGLDGNNKMSKSLNNAIFISDEKDVIVKKVKQLFTCNRTSIQEPGKIEQHMPLYYLSIFNPIKYQELAPQYQLGGLGDKLIKDILVEDLMNVLEPIQKKRKMLEQEEQYLLEILKKGHEKVQPQIAQYLEKIKQPFRRF